MSGAHIPLGEPGLPDGRSAEERLERGEILYWSSAPFSLPEGDDHAMLLEQRLAGLAHKNISHNPHTGETTGFAWHSAEQAKRLGAVVSAYDLRPAVKEQVQSLGGRFVEIAIEAKDAQDARGYATAQGEEFYKKQRELLGKVIAESDVVITAAVIPGKDPPANRPLPPEQADL